MKGRRLKKELFRNQIQSNTFLFHGFPNVREQILETGFRKCLREGAERKPVFKSSVVREITVQCCRNLFDTENGTPPLVTGDKKTVQPN